MNRRFILGSLFLLIPFQFLDAQPVYKPLNYSLRSFNQYNQGWIKDDSAEQQTSFHPNLSNNINGNEGQYYRSYVPLNQKDSSFLLRKRYKQYSWFRRKLMYENFIVIDTGDIYITIDPLINVAYGRESGYINEKNKDQTLYNNTRGLLIRADIGKKFSLETYAYENQAVLPYHVDTFVTTYGVVPGQGRVKTFYNKGFDFSQAGGYFSYNPWKFLSVQFGHHKHFIGEGYRSLILSDNSFNYPFLRYNLSFWKNRINYSVMYASFQNLNRLPSSNTSEATFFRKGGSFHVLEYIPSNWLRVQFYEGNIWKTMNPNGSSSGNYWMYNPVIFSSALFADYSSYNGVVGAGFRLRPLKHLNLYSTVVKHNKGDSKIGYQAGAYYFILPTLRVQFEYNHMDEMMFGRDTLLTYTHYNQSLGHPFNQGYDEFLIRFNYRWRRLLVEAQFNYTDFINSEESVIIRPLVLRIPDPEDYFNYRKEYLMGNIELAYLVNPATNLKLFASFTHRIDEKIYFFGISQTSNFFYLGIRTDLRNIYYDY